MSSSSVGVLHLIAFLFCFLMYMLCICALQSPKYCFNQSRETVCGVTTEYPLDFIRGESCGYPGFGFDCDISRYGGRPFINISNHIYHVLEIRYDEKIMKMVDLDVERSSCPQPKQNFSLPSSPPWVNYDIPSGINDYVTIFYNCTSVPDYAEKYLVCSREDYNTTNTSASYAPYYSYQDEFVGNCAKNVHVPIDNTVYVTNAANYSNAINAGFFIGWSAIDWCEDCERSGGQCWSIQNSTGCACKNNQSYNRTCPLLTPPHHQGLNTGLKIIIGVLSGIGGVLFVALLMYVKGFRCLSHWRNKNNNPTNIEQFLEKYGCLALQRYKYSEIKKMTNSFKDTLGQGGYGQVFKGELHDGHLVAVKLLNEAKGNGEDFINEVATIGRTNHVNVVNLVGFCIEGTRRALVYDFMPNGSLERFIYIHKKSSTTLPLGWEKLYQITLGIARGLEYLHRGCNTRILHFDIKPHNILLDQNFCPKISDFGLAKLYPSRESTVSTVGARGTMGYIAPELYSRTFGNVSHKSDVYSYGMMMLEMIGGRKNIDATVDNISEIYFPLWIYSHLKQNYDATVVEDIHAREVYEDENAKKMILVALWCIQAHPVDRPSMSRVVEMLEGNTSEIEMPPNPSVVPHSSTSTSS